MSQRTNQSRPDAYVHLEEKTFPDTKAVSWADIVMPMEFKKASNARASSDDFSKVMWSIHHTMRNDPRRRFTFGLTMENTSARLWFNDRCGIVASEKFDINNDWQMLAYVISAVIRASFIELGFDPDMKLSVADEKSPQYDITIHSFTQKEIVYRTIGILADVGADSLIGRGTRVWKARKLGKDGKSSGLIVTLKDGWVHPDRATEHHIISEIKRSQPDYASYFLTVLEAGFALVSQQDSQQDNTRHTIRRGKDFELTGQVLRPRAAIDNNQDNASGSLTSGLSTTSSRHTPLASLKGHWDYLQVNLFPRQHYRIVFEEVGIPVHELRSYQEIIVAVRGASKGLHAIHLDGRVHRDVSSGNILFVQGANGQSGLGKIIDLEYTKKVDVDPDDVKTGTYEFMAIEVAQSDFIHDSTPPVDFLAEPVPLASPPFRQNQLHDLESIWWVLAWISLRTVGPYDSPTKQYLENYDKVFRNHEARSLFWLNDCSFRMNTIHFARQGIAIALQIWCQKLRDAYRNSYADKKFRNVTPSTLEDVLKIQEEALQAISKVTADYSSDLKYLSELRADLI